MVTIRNGFSVTLDAERVRRAMNDAPRALEIELRAALDDIGLETKRVTRTMFIPRTAVGERSTSDKLQYGRGNLFRTVDRKVFGSRLDDMSLIVFSEGVVKYGPTHEFGDPERTPTSRQYMTIPLRAALTPSGSLKGGMRIVKRGNRYYTASGMSTRVIETADGRKFIVGTTGYSRVQRALGARQYRVGGRQPSTRELRQKRQDVLLYALRERVRIPARPFLGRAWDESAQYRQARLQRAVDNALETIGGA